MIFIIKKSDELCIYKTTGISRNKLLKIIKDSNLLYNIDGAKDIDMIEFIPRYVAALEEIDEHLRDTSYRDNYHLEDYSINSSFLSKRQLYLSDFILQVIVESVIDNLSSVYHEIYDFIYDYDNPKDSFEYGELVLLQRIIMLLLKLLKADNK